MKFPLLALGALLLGGCDDGPQSQPKPPAPMGYWISTQGYVREIVVRDGSQGSYVIIETEEHALFTVHLMDGVPPVWKGLHGQFVYESASKEAGTWKNFLVVKRLDLEVK